MKGNKANTDQTDANANDELEAFKQISEGDKYQAGKVIEKQEESGGAFSGQLNKLVVEKQVDKRTSNNKTYEETFEAKSALKEAQRLVQSGKKEAAQ